MSKLWYPVAISVTLASCGGETDSGRAGPAAGGSTHVDTGVPTQTGGWGANVYGVRMTGGTPSTYATGGLGPVPPYGVIPVYGGATAANTVSGGASATGGSSSVDGGSPAATGGRPPIVYGVIGLYGLRR
jgi:hypothetical protein